MIARRLGDSHIRAVIFDLQKYCEVIILAAKDGINSNLIAPESRFDPEQKPGQR